MDFMFNLGSEGELKTFVVNGVVVVEVVVVVLILNIHIDEGISKTDVKVSLDWFI